MTRRTPAGANARTLPISQAEAERTALWIANAAMAVAFFILLVIPS